MYPISRMIRNPINLGTNVSRLSSAFWTLLRISILAIKSFLLW
jgi:hypothetical protein